MKKHTNRTIFFLFLSSFLFSCAEDKECRQEKFVQLSANFYKEEQNVETGSKRVEKLSVDSVLVLGLGSDSLLYDNAKRINQLNLPLRKLENKTEFVIQCNASKDTVSFFHTNTHEFLSFECGYLTNFRLDSVQSTTNFIDSIIIKSPDVKIFSVENIQIYHTSN